MTDEGGKRRHGFESLLAWSDKASRISPPPTKLVACPFEVRIDGALHDRFYDLRDAVTSARIAKRDNPTRAVVVIDVRTGKIVFELERLFLRHGWRQCPEKKSPRPTRLTIAHQVATLVSFPCSAGWSR